jgi:hypothetical protein
MRHFLFWLLLLFSPSANAEMNHYTVNKSAPPSQSAGSGSYVVTSLKKCLDQLSPEAAAQVRKNIETPYEECRNRLAAQEGKNKIVSDTPTDLPAERPAQYFRVAGSSKKEGTEDKPGNDTKKPVE